MPSRSLRTPFTTSKRQSSSALKEKWNGPAVSGSVTESLPMAAPISPAATVPPVAKERATGAVSSRSSTAMRRVATPPAWRVPSSKTKERPRSTCGSAPAALKPSKSSAAFGRMVAMRSAAFQVAEKKAAIGAGRLDRDEAREVAFQREVGDPVRCAAALGDARGRAAPVPDHRHLLPLPDLMGGSFCRCDESGVKVGRPGLHRFFQASASEQGEFGPERREA